jgi:hypothetical protein
MPFFAALLASLAINAGIYLLTGFLTPGRKQDVGKPNFPAADPEKYLPIIFGTVRLPINVFWTGQIRTEEIRRTRNILFGWGPSDVIGHRYYYTLMGWLCHGGLSGFCDIIIDGKYFLSRVTPQQVRDGDGVDGTVVTTVYDTQGNPVNVYKPTYTSPTGMIGGVTWFLGKAPDGVLIDTMIPALFGDPVIQGGVQGKFRIYPGDGSHNQNAKMLALNPVYAKAVYPEFSYLVLEDVWLGNSGNPPGVEIVVCRASAKLSLGNPLIGYPNSPFGGAFNGFAQGDANPIGIIFELLINKKIGIGFPRPLLDLWTFQAAYTALNPYEAGDDYGLSGVITEHQPADELIATILAHIDAVLFLDPTTGLLAIRLIREFLGDPMTLPLLDESNILSCEYNYSVQNETVNEIQVEFVNIYRNLQRDIVKAQNLAAVQRARGVSTERMEFLWATRPDIALKIAQRELRVQSSRIGRGTLQLTRSGMMLTPGMHVRVTHPDVGTNVVCRIGTVDIGSLAAGAVTAGIMQDRWLSEASVYVAPPPDETNQPQPSRFYPPWVDINVASDTVYSTIYNLLVNDPFGVVTAVEYTANPNGTWVPFSGEPYWVEIIKGEAQTRTFWRVTYTDENGVSQYLMGEFPTPVAKIYRITPPEISYQYVGTDVEITITTDLPTLAIHMAYSYTAPPDDTTVVSSSDFGPTPYVFTVPAPTGSQMLYVGAMANDSTFGSPVVRVAIAPAPAAAPTDVRTIQFPFGNGETMGAALAWLPASPGYDFTVLSWKVRALKADRSQANIDATFTVKKVLEAGGTLVDLGGGTLTMTGVSEASGSASAWANKVCLANDEIIVTLETMTNANAVTSLLFTLTVQKN